MQEPENVKRRGKVTVDIKIDRTEIPGRYATSDVPAQAHAVVEIPLAGETLAEQAADLKRILADAVDRALDDANQNLDIQVRIAKAEKRKAEADADLVD